MPKPKGALNLKWTSVDEEAKQWRRAQRAARYKAESYSRHHRSRSASPHNPFTESRSDDVERHPLEDEFNAHHLPPESLQKLREEIEEARFRAKLSDAMDDDERLDRLEASFNAHIPARWSSPGASGSQSASRDDDIDASGLDPSYMTEEQYAEWIRQGMWRRTHRTEVESAERRAQARAAQRERERKAQETVEKEERDREQRRAQRKKEKERKAREQAWDAYRRKWEMLTRIAAEASASDASISNSSEAHSRERSSRSRSASSLRFTDVPWPMYPPPNDPSLITKANISSFLFSKDHSHDKTRKQRTREALLAYHPDRFVGRYMPAIHVGDRAEVQETVVRVTGFLNALAEEHGSG